MKPTGWETENIPVTPQGAQLKRYAQWTYGSIRSADDGDLCHYDEAAERIEKLGRELIEERECSHRWELRNQELLQERDTALRALAEARRDAAELRKIAERMLGWHNAPQDCYSTGPVHGDARDTSCPSCELVSFLKHIDAARQPEKDANNG